MKNLIITIGREYGSGGKYIGEEVAKRLGYKFYDKELLQKIYENHDCNYALLEAYDEKTQNTLSKFFQPMYTNDLKETFTEEKYRSIVKETIQKLAEQKSCVFIGRDTNQILKDYPNALHFFIYAKDEEFKIERKMQVENLTHEEAKQRMKHVDKMREKFYISLNKGHRWGDKDDYDFCLDSSVLGIEKTIDVIVHIIKSFEEKEQ